MAFGESSAMDGSGVQQGKACKTSRLKKAVAPVERFFVRYRERLVWVHALSFVAFLAMILGPLALPEPVDGASPLNDLTLFANYALWGLWFPLVFLSVIFTGRSWCGVLCPMGAAAEWANRRGPQWAIPSWVRWEGTPVVSFLVITLLGQTLGVRDHREAVAMVFGGTMLAAITLGFLYGRKKRAWCRHMCPIGLLLGVFSRLGAVEFAPAHTPKGEEGYTERGVCPTMIDLPRKQESRHCIECFRCVNPEAKGSIRLQLRRPGAEVENIRDHHANRSEVWFLFLGTGVALGGFLWLVLPVYQVLRQMLGEWAIGQGWLWIGETGPWWLMSVHPERREVFVWLDFLSITGFMAACMAALTLMLTATTAAAAWAAERHGASGGRARLFTELGYQYAPVAMVSLVLGLAGPLFEPLRMVMGKQGVGLAKAALFAMGLAWSVRLALRILHKAGATRRLLPLLPGVLGSLGVGIAWWPAIFGL